MDCHKMAIGFYAGINWPGGMQVMKTKPNGTGKLAHRCICCIQKIRCWFNKPRVRTKHPQCLEQLPSFVAASAHQVTARSVSKLVAKVGIGKVHGQMPAWWDVSNMIYRHILPSAFFQVLPSCLRIFQGYSFSWVGLWHAVQRTSALQYPHWKSLLDRNCSTKKAIPLPVEAAQLVTSYIFLSFFSLSLSSFQFPVV